MKKCIFVILLASVLIMPCAGATCSLGANPLETNARALPGQTVAVRWNLYNLYGDRATHVAVTKIDGPGWDVRMEPGLVNEKYNVSGVIETVQESVALEPAPAVDEVPEQKPAGMDYVKHPNAPGYIPVRPVMIRITVPENAEKWKDYNFTFEAKGSCFTEPGAVMPSVATQLKLSIRVISGDYFENKITEEVPQENASSSGPAGEGITGMVSVNAQWIGIGASLIAALFLVLYFGVARKK
jgi:hypothetical protein